MNTDHTIIMSLSNNAEKKVYKPSFVFYNIFIVFEYTKLRSELFIE